MAVMGIGQYPGLQVSYASREIKTVDISEVKRQETEQEQAKRFAESGLSPRMDSGEGDERTKRITDLENISLTFNRQDDFSYIGRDSSPKMLDMQRAISDMQKDDILSQYSFFAGRSANLSGNMGGQDPLLEGIIRSISEDGVVVIK